MEPKLCYVRESYFKKNAAFRKMLDAGNTDKQSKRTHLCVMVEKDGNHFYIPLRNNLGADVRKFGRIGHCVPSEKRKNAGLDYRYAIIVNDETYIESIAERKIPRSQYRCICSEYKSIQTEFSTYVNGFKRAVKKRRNEKEPLYRESSLVNFLQELGLTEVENPKPAVDIALACHRVQNTDARVEGLCPGTWQRLPDDVLKEVGRPELTALAHHTSGAVLRFRTDSPVLGFVMEVSEPDAVMSHMPLTGSAGMDVFADGKYAGTFRAEPGVGTVWGEIALPEQSTRAAEITVYLPLYNGVRKFELGIRKNARLLPPVRHKIERPLVFYGSSITQGACASRTSNAYPALVARWLDAEMICLGFSGNAKGETAIAQYISDLDAGCLIYDYDYNAPDAAFLKATHQPFLETILARNPSLPVLALSRPNPEWKKEENETDARKEIIQETVRRCREKGYRVSFLDGAELFGEESRECCTVDGVHPNDLGFYRIARRVYNEIISGSSPALPVQKRNEREKQ